ncbi:MAG: hypothetical protein ACTH31_03770 [Pseudoclavibacter sp.]
MTVSPARPSKRGFLKTGTVEEYIATLGRHCAEHPDDYPARVDYLAALLKSGENEAFLEAVDGAGAWSRRSAIARLLGMYLLFERRDLAAAREVLGWLADRDATAPAWVHYFAGRPRTYYTKLTDGLLYTPIPKNASTSLKSFVLTNVLAKPDRNPHASFDNPFFKLPIHDEATIADATKVVIVRRPEARLTSYHGKNILGEGSLAHEYGLDDSDQETLFGLSLRPTLEEFVDNLPRYCIVFNDVFHHTLPQAAYVGDLQGYDYICDVAEVDDLVTFVADRLGLGDKVDATAPKRMVGGAKPAREERAELDAKVRSLYADDYALLAQSPAHPSFTPGIREYAPSSTRYAFPG